MVVTNLMFSLFPLLLIIWLIEIILSSTWNKFYFRNGLNLYTSNIDSDVLLTLSEEEIEYLNNKLTNNYLPNIKFKKISEDEIAFREKSFFFTILNYPPVMHGYIKNDFNKNKISIKGRANWFISLIPILLILFAGIISNLEFISTSIFHFLIPIFLLFGIYALQRNRYNKILNEIQMLVEHYRD